MNGIKKNILVAIKKTCEIFSLRSLKIYSAVHRRLPSGSPAFTDAPSQALRELKTITIDDFKNNSKSKILIFGIPKSGNVWLLNLLQDIIGFDDQVSFTHQPFSDQRFDPTILRSVCIVRDLRDVICSYYRYTKRQGNRDNTIGYFDSVEEFYYKYFYLMLRNNTNNIDLSLPDKVVSYGVPVIKYEDLVANTACELEKLFSQWRFAGIKNEVIKSAVAKYRLTQNNRPKYRAAEHIKPDHAQYITEKEYSKLMPENLIRHVEKHFGNYIERWGYPMLFF